MSLAFPGEELKGFIRKTNIKIHLLTSLFISDAGHLFRRLPFFVIYYVLKSVCALLTSYTQVLKYYGRFFVLYGTVKLSLKIIQMTFGIQNIYNNCCNKLSLVRKIAMVTKRLDIFSSSFVSLDVEC